MKVLSVVTICESLNTTGGKYASGNVMDFAKFFQPHVLEQLDAAHSGAFAFLAFNPTSDQAVANYVLEGTLASDAGPDLLVLFTVDKAARFPTDVKIAIKLDAVDVDIGEHVSYGFVRMVFPKKSIDGFPGIVFFARLTGPVEPIYVRLESAKVRQAVQQLSALCSEALREAGADSSFAAALAPRLARARFNYARGGSTSMSEWLHKVVNVLRPYKKDIVTAALKVATAGVLGKKQGAPEDEEGQS